MKISPVNDTSPPTQGRRPVFLICAFVSVALSALALGGLTSPAQQYLPEYMESMANSSSGWMLLVCVIIWLSRLRPIPAAVAGAMAFVLMVEGYRIASEWRGFYYGEPFQDRFTFIGLLVGPIIGASMALLRYGSFPWRTLAATPVLAVLLGEGLYGLTVVHETTSPVYWWVLIAVGCAMLIAVLRAHHASIKLATGTTLIALFGAAAFWFVYSAGSLDLINTP